MISFRHSALYIIPFLWVSVTGYAGEAGSRFDFGQITGAFEKRWNELSEEVESSRTSPFLGAIEVAEETTLAEGTVASVPPVKGNPPFAGQTLHPSGRSTVFGVAAARNTDVVLLNSGFDQGFRVGMLCEIVRQGVPIGEIVLVEVKDNRTAALILNLENNQHIQFGDIVRIKTVQYHS